jgi:hypothetical protein
MLIAVATPEVGFKGRELRRFAPHASDDTPLSVVNWLVRETYPAMSDDTALLPVLASASKSTWDVRDRRAIESKK